MSKKPFLVVIDTTEARMNQSGVGVGILNVHLVLAESAETAKLTLLDVFRPNVKNAIKDYLYAYEISEVEQNLNTFNQDIFSFIPLQGGRPPRQSFNPETVSKTVGNTTLSSNQPQVQPPQSINAESRPLPQVQQPVKQQLPTDIRGRGFNNIEPVLPETTDVISLEQAKLLTSLGVTPQKFGGDEGSQPRINSSIGGNANLVNTIAPQRTSEVLTEDKADILRSIGVNPDGKEIVSSVQPDENTNIGAFIDPALTEVDGVTLSEEDIERLKNEIKES